MDAWLLWKRVEYSCLSLTRVVFQRSKLYATFVFKQKYGLEVVSSVIYENQAKYYPVLQEQLALFENKENWQPINKIDQEIISNEKVVK